MKSFAIELQDNTVEYLMEIWGLKTTAEFRDMLQKMVVKSLPEVVADNEQNARDKI